MPSVDSPESLPHQEMHAEPARRTPQYRRMSLNPIGTIHIPHKLTFGELGFVREGSVRGLPIPPPHLHHQTVHSTLGRVARNLHPRLRVDCGGSRLVGPNRANGN